jgi:hypothetical protein
MSSPVFLRALACAAALAAAVALPAGCKGTPADLQSVRPDAAADPMSADLFPFAASSARFVLDRGGDCTVRVEAADSAATLWIDAGGNPGRIDVRREGDALLFDAGPGSVTELVRIGAVPGTEWLSGVTTVRFDGWERIVLPGGTCDAARVSAASGPPTLRIVQTWWFAPGRGLVRFRSDRGGIFSEGWSLADRL